MTEIKSTDDYVAATLATTLEDVIKTAGPNGPPLLAAMEHIMNRTEMHTRAICMAVMMGVICASYDAVPDAERVDTTPGGDRVGFEDRMRIFRAQAMVAYRETLALQTPPEPEIEVPPGSRVQ